VSKAYYHVVARIIRRKLMKVIPARVVRHVLRQLGLKPQARGNGTDHDVWVSPEGRTCQPKLCKKDMDMAVVFSLSQELQSKGIVSRRAFLAALRAA
jgi:hypothetical protein